MDFASLDEEIASALKADDTLKKDVLRYLKNLLTLAEKEKGAELTIKEKNLLIKQEISRREQAIELLSSINRDDRVLSEKAELDILTRFLPPQLSIVELESALTKFAADNQEIAGDFGSLMKLALKQYGDIADAKDIARILKKII